MIGSSPWVCRYFSAHSKEGAYSTFKALALGAIDFVAKPRDAAAGNLEPVALQLADKIKVAKRAGGPKMIPKPAVEQAVAVTSKKRTRPALPPNRPRKQNDKSRRGRPIRD